MIGHGLVDGILLWLYIQPQYVLLLSKDNDLF